MPLTEEDANTIIDAFLERYRKELDVEQRGLLLGKKDVTETGSPLYLLTALEELRTLGIYEEITDRIRELPDETQPLFGWILQRLERDDGFRDQEGALIGEELVRAYCSYLAIGRKGMSQAELVGLIAPPAEGRPLAHLRPLARQASKAEADPLGNVAALRALLSPYQMRRGGLLDFFHAQLREAVEGVYLDQPEEERNAHRAVAEHFLSQANSVRDGTWEGEMPRGLRELLFHLKSAGMWTEIAYCLREPGISDRLWPGVYGVGGYSEAMISGDYQHDYVWWEGLPDPDALDPGDLAQLPSNVRFEAGYAIADAFAGQARRRIEKTKTFRKPWPETARRLRERLDEGDPAGFVEYRDTFYTFCTLAGRAARFALAAFTDSDEGRRELRRFAERCSGFSSFLHYLNHFGAAETGLSHALEDNHAWPSLVAWREVQSALVASDASS